MRVSQRGVQSRGVAMNLEKVVFGFFVVLVGLHPPAQPGHVELRVELGGEDVGAEPVRLHRTCGRQR
jgi:hypothetical protein